MVKTADVQAVITAWEHVREGLTYMTDDLHGMWWYEEMNQAVSDLQASAEGGDVES